MLGAKPLLSQYASMAWRSAKKKAQGQLYLHFCLLLSKLNVNIKLSYQLLSIFEHRCIYRHIDTSLLYHIPCTVVNNVSLYNRKVNIFV
jgi:hypothetical protein